MFHDQEAVFKALKDNAKAGLKALEDAVSAIHRVKNIAFRQIHLPGDERTTLLSVLIECKRTVQLVRQLSAARASNIPASRLSDVNTAVSAMLGTVSRLNEAVETALASNKPWRFSGEGRIYATISGDEMSHVGQVGSEIHQHLDTLRNSTSALGLNSGDTSADKAYEATVAEIARRANETLGKAQEAGGAITEFREGAESDTAAINKLKVSLDTTESDVQGKIGGIIEAATAAGNQASTALLAIQKSHDDVKTSVEELETSIDEANEQFADVKGFSEELQKIKADLEETRSQAASAHDEQKRFTKRVSELISEAESMVSGATTAGLASAFDEERQKLSDSMKWALVSFVVGIAFLFGTTILLAAYVFEIPLSVLGYQLGQAGATAERGDEITLAGVISRTVILLAPFWLTLFSSRRYRNLFDLRQQYTHKYSMAFSVDGFKQQAPQYAEQLAAWVFHVVAEPPVSVKSSKGMGDSPLLDVESVVRAQLERFGSLNSKKSSDGES